MILQDLDAKYTLGNNWILRIDPYYYSKEYSIYNINSRLTFYISKACYTFLDIFSRNSLSYNDINRFFVQENINFDWDGFWRMCKQIIPFDLLVKSDTPLLRNNLCNENFDISCFDIPIASTPFNMEVHLTHRCNLNCIHCFQNSSPLSDKFRELTCSDWIRIFDQLELNKVRNVMISGGEPLFYSHFTDLFTNVVDKQINYAVLTNATLVNSSNIDVLSHKNVTLSISLDGFSEELHDRYRGKGAFKKVISIIRDLVSNGANITLSCTVSSVNYLYIREIIELACSLKVSGISFAFIEKMGRTNENTFLLLSPLQRIEVKETYLALQQEFGEIIDLNFIDPSSSFAKSNFSNHIYCSAGTIRAAVSADGKLYPCTYAFGSDELIIGDLVKEELHELWRNQDKWSLFRGNIELEKINSCGICSMKDSCNLKNCRLKSYDLNKSLYNKPIECMADFL